MPAIERNQAAHRLAAVVEKAKPLVLDRFVAELFPEEEVAAELSAAALAEHVRCQLEAEEIVDFWNVVFPGDRNVWYNDEDDKIHYNEESLGYAETD